MLTNLVIGSVVVFNYEGENETRGGVVEKFSKDRQSVTLQDRARDGAYRSFRLAKMTNARITGHGPVVA